MRRVWPIVVLLLAAMAAGVASATPATTTPATPHRAIVVLATGLTWSDVTPTSTPTLWRLASEGAVGDLNAVLRAHESGELPSALEGALDISAGNWVAPEFYAQGAFNTTESVEGSSAALAYERRMGTGPGGNAIAFLGLPPTVHKTPNAAEDVVVGTLGQAIEDTGGSTVAIGNSDAGDPVVRYKIVRPAALAVMDQRGLVRFGNVSRDLLTEAPDAPIGLQTDLAAFEQALGSAEASAAAHGGPTLIALDPGDAYRVQRFSWQATDTVATAMRQAASRELDDVVAMALRRSGRDDLVIVTGQSPPVEPSAGTPGFSPILVSGRGLHGYLTSGSTHRQGIVSNPDVTATLMQHLGVLRPVQVIGTPMAADPAPATPAERIDYLSRLNTTAVAQNAVRGTFASVFTCLFVTLVALGIAFVGFGARLSAKYRARSAVALQASCIAVASIPAGAWVMFLLTPTVSSPGEFWLSLLGASAILFAIAMLVWRLAGGRFALAAILLGSVVVLVADQLLGAPLSRTNLIGYSPLDSARYYGIGNEAAALLVGCALVGLALVSDELRDSVTGRRWRQIGLPIVGAAVVFVCAAPFFGANVGVAIWGSAGFIVAWALMNGRRITYKTVIAAVLVIVVAIGAFAAIDIFGGGSQTHLARSVASAEQGGASQLWLIVQRKAETNARVLGKSSWSILLAATVAFLLALRWLPRHPLSRLLAEHPAFASAIWAATAAGVLAFLTEDTGIDVPSWIWLALGMAAVWLAVWMADDEWATK